MLVHHDEYPPRVIAVLGNGLIQENGKIELPDHVRQRLDYAVALYHASREKPLMIVLGKWSFWYRKGNTPATTEADEMQRYLQTKGLPQEAVYPEKKSEDTIGNALYLKDALVPTKIRHITILCADYHAERAAFIFHMLLGKLFSLTCIPTDGPFLGSELKRQKQLQRDLLAKQMPFLKDLRDHPKLQENLYDRPYYTNLLRQEVSETGKSALGVNSEIER